MQKKNIVLIKYKYPKVVKVVRINNLDQFLYSHLSTLNLTLCACKNTLDIYLYVGYAQFFFTEVVLVCNVVFCHEIFVNALSNLVIFSRIVHWHSSFQVSCENV